MEIKQLDIELLQDIRGGVSASGSPSQIPFISIAGIDNETNSHDVGNTPSVALD